MREINVLGVGVSLRGRSCKPEVFSRGGNYTRKSEGRRNGLDYFIQKLEGNGAQESYEWRRKLRTNEILLQDY